MLHRFSVCFTNYIRVFFHNPVHRIKISLDSGKKKIETPTNAGIDSPRNSYSVSKRIGIVIERDLPKNSNSFQSPRIRC